MLKNMEQKSISDVLTRIAERNNRFFDTIKKQDLFMIRWMLS